MRDSLACSDSYSCMPTKFVKLPSVCGRVLTVIIFLFSPKVYSQFGTEAEEKVDTTLSYFEITAFTKSNSRTPFWFQANQFGTVPTQRPVASARIGVERYWTLLSNQKNRNWCGGGGLEVVTNFSSHTKVLLPQLHGGIKYKRWEFYVGRKKQFVGLADSTLGSGSYAWSGNALPIPKIYLGTIGFVPVPFTKDWLSFQLFYSDGLFENNRPITSNLKLHQKALYLRIGKPFSRLRLYGGFNHQVQWGGKSPYLTGPNGEMPKGFSNYLHAVLGTVGGSGNNVTFFDSTSRIGNHLGSIDIAAEIQTYETRILLYKQFVYEDGSLFYLTTLNDGLYGISIKRNHSYGANFEIMHAVFEFLYTKNQGGDNFVLGVGKYRGHDNYFNNQQVRDGWSYYDRTIGNPFIPPTSQTVWGWPNYADNFTSNNRVLLYHLGLGGTLLRKINWFTKLSYSINSGTYHAPFSGSPSQFSGIFMIQTKIDKIPGLAVGCAYAADIGKLYPNERGFRLNIRKSFSLEN